MAWRAGVALGVLVLLPPPVFGQQEGIERAIRGQVVDGSGAPIHLAMVGLAQSNQAVATDAEGRFLLPVPPGFRYRVAAEQLGYHPTEVWIAAEDIEHPLVITLEPDPIALRGLEVTVDRLERRRRRYAGFVRVVDREALGLASATTAYEVIRRHAPGLRPCLGDPYNDCVMRRGSISPVRICIDERPAWGGRDELEAYRPEELYMVEVYDWGRAVRVYTNWYVDKVMKKPQPIVPIEFGC